LRRIQQRHLRHAKGTIAFSATTKSPEQPMRQSIKLGRNGFERVGQPLGVASRNQAKTRHAKAGGELGPGESVTMRQPGPAIGG
jgi:hypothetical protein